MGTNDCQCWRCNRQPMSHGCEYGPIVAESIRERDEARAEVERLRGRVMVWADQIEDGWKHGDPALFVISITEMRKEGEKR